MNTSQLLQDVTEMLLEAYTNKAMLEAHYNLRYDSGPREDHARESKRCKALVQVLEGVSMLHAIENPPR